MRSDTDHAFAVTRGDASGDHVLGVVTRLAGSVHGWDDHEISVPSGTWTDLLTGRTVTSEGTVALAGILDRLPVALLTRTDG